MLGKSKINNKKDKGDEKKPQEKLTTTKKVFSHETIKQTLRGSEDEAPESLTNAYYVKSSDFSGRRIHNESHVTPSLCFSCARSKWDNTKNKLNHKTLFCDAKNRRCYTMEIVRMTGRCEQYQWLLEQGDN